MRSLHLRAWEHAVTEDMSASEEALSIENHAWRGEVKEMGGQRTDLENGIHSGCPSRYHAIVPVLSVLLSLAIIRFVVLSVIVSPCAVRKRVRNLHPFSF